VIVEEEEVMELLIGEVIKLLVGEMLVPMRPEASDVNRFFPFFPFLLCTYTVATINATTARTNIVTLNACMLIETASPSAKTGNLLAYVTARLNIAVNTSVYTIRNIAIGFPSFQLNIFANG
jgi:hypothetical protein